MKMLLVGAVGMLVLQVLLVGGHLVASSQDPFILNPNSGSLEEDGITMVMLCWEGHTPEGRLRLFPKAAKLSRMWATPMIQVLAPFAPLFSKNVFQHVQLLLVGAFPQLRAKGP